MTSRLHLAVLLALLAAPDLTPDPAMAQKPLEMTQRAAQAKAMADAVAAARAGTTATAASACAALPETGQVARPAPDVTTPARLLPNRSYSCAAGSRLDLSGRLPVCITPGFKVTDGSPRAACYAKMPLGPFAAIGPRQRPTRSCPTSRLTAIVRLEGPGAGLADVTLAIVPEGSVTATTLIVTGEAVPQDENPILQNCFPFDCRLVKLEISNKAPDKVRLDLTLPQGDPVAAEIRLDPVCPL